MLNELFWALKKNGRHARATTRPDADVNGGNRGGTRRRATRGGWWLTEVREPSQNERSRIRSNWPTVGVGELLPEAHYRGPSPSSNSLSRPSRVLFLRRFSGRSASSL